MTQTKPDVFLMYRRPNEDDHEKLTDVMDDILNRLERIEKRLEEMDK